MSSTAADPQFRRLAPVAASTKVEDVFCRSTFADFLSHCAAAFDVSAPAAGLNVPAVHTSLVQCVLFRIYQEVYRFDSLDGQPYLSLIPNMLF